MCCFYWLKHGWSVSDSSLSAVLWWCTFTSQVCAILTCKEYSLSSLSLLTISPHYLSSLSLLTISLSFSLPPLPPLCYILIMSLLISVWKIKEYFLQNNVFTKEFEIVTWLVRLCILQRPVQYSLDGAGPSVPKEPDCCTKIGLCFNTINNLPSGKFTW